jgi:hypothetical protein
MADQSTPDTADRPVCYDIGMKYRRAVNKFIVLSTLWLGLIAATGWVLCRM